MPPVHAAATARALQSRRAANQANPMPGVTPRPTRTLESLEPGAAAPVERIPDQFEHEPGFLEYLDSVGVKPGVVVRLVAIAEDGMRIAVDGGERTVRRDVGRKVLVRR